MHFSDISTILPVKVDLSRKLGDRIKILRKKRLLTQELLGERSSISYKFIGEIERGEANPSIDILSRIADALEVSLQDLFIFAEETAAKVVPSYHESGDFGSYVMETLKGLIPSHDIKRQRQIVKALKLMKSALKN